MKSVMVIGLGRMGAALARVLLEANNQVTVWNRSAQKAGPLVAAGALLAESVVKGIAANDVIVICLGDYADVNSVLTHEASLSGKTIIQLTSATPEEAVSMEAWMTGAGALYLDGAILSFPSGVGKPGCALPVAGSKAAWASGEDVVMCLGPASQYLGENVATPAALDLALLQASFFTQLGVIHAAYQIEAAGLSVSDHADVLIAAASPAVYEAGARVQAIVDDAYSDPEAGLVTWWHIIRKLVNESNRGTLRVASLEGIGQVMQRALDMGLGQEDLAALIKVWRAQA